MATGIADGGGHDAGELPEILFVTPEAAETEDGGPRPVRPRTGERGPEDAVDAGLHDRVGAAGEGFSGGGDDVGLGTEETHVETIGRTRDGTVTARPGPARTRVPSRGGRLGHGVRASRCQSRSRSDVQGTFVPSPPVGSKRYAEVGPPSSGIIRILVESGAQVQRALPASSGPVWTICPVPSARTTDRRWVARPSNTCQNATHRPSGETSAMPSHVAPASPTNRCGSVPSAFMTQSC